MYIYQEKHWPVFHWDSSKLTSLLADVRFRQGKLLGKMEDIGFTLRGEATLHTLTLEIIKSNEIEGEMLDREQVRSSIARRLGIDIGGTTPASRYIEGVVEMMLNATQQFQLPLSDERLFSWHAALFPTGYSGLHKIRVAGWRDGSNGPMQVVSGPPGREKVHYEAPHAAQLQQEMNHFLQWFNDPYPGDTDPILRAAVAHLWFITIHPFEDGNGRIARAITDMLLARADGSAQRFYSMSAQIEREKKNYYLMLEHTQKGSLDITPWLEWFLQSLMHALESAEVHMATVLRKAAFRTRTAAVPLNARQHYMTEKLCDDFFGKLTSSKWAKMTKCSQDTALRDIQDLIDKKILVKQEGGGRSTGYTLSGFSTDAQPQ